MLKIRRGKLSIAMFIILLRAYIDRDGTSLHGQAEYYDYYKI